MKSPSMQLALFAFFIAFNSLASADMDLTEEAKHDEAFLRRYNCFPEHFHFDKYLADAKYAELIADSNRLERLGYLDRYILKYKAHALYKLRRYEEAVPVLEQSMQAEYVCQLTAFHGRFAHPLRIADAIALFNISEVYKAMSQTSLEKRYCREALERLRHTLLNDDRIPAERIDSVIARILHSFSLDAEIASNVTSGIKK